MSPYRLLQEQVDRDRHYPWRVLVSCALLNRTRGTQAHPVAGELFERWSNPIDFARDLNDWNAAGCFEDLCDMLRPLGLMRRRSELLKLLTEDYCAGALPAECFGVGQYAQDSLAIFCEGRTDLDPVDSHLGPYLEWARHEHNGSRIEWDEDGYWTWFGKRHTVRMPWPSGGPHPLPSRAPPPRIEWAVPGWVK